MVTPHPLPQKRLSSCPNRQTPARSRAWTNQLALDHRSRQYVSSLSFRKKLFVRKKPTQAMKITTQ